MKTYIKQISALLFISLIISCSKEEVCYEADLVLVNSKIYTANADQWEAASLAILGDKFIFVGSNDDSSAYACGSNRVLDLKDSFVFPGFIDAHAHLKGIGYREITLNLQGADSLKNMLTLVQIHSNKRVLRLGGHTQNTKNRDFSRSRPPAGQHLQKGKS